MLTLAFALATAVQDADPLRQLEELRREIDLLRTVHSLGLTKDQLGKLVAAAQGARSTIDQAVAERKEDLAALRKALEEYREAMEKGEKELGDRERRLGEFQRTIGELMRRQHETVEKLATETKAILDERQWRTLTAMHRHDPLRPMREQFTRFLDRLREDSEMELNEEVLSRFREGVQRTARHLGLNEKDAEAEFERLRKVLEEAFKMTGEELAKKRDELVRRVFEEGKIADALKRMGPPPEEETRRTAMLFLSPNVIRFLEKRLESAK